MEAAAQSRKEKLAALRKRKADEDAGLVSRESARPRAGAEDDDTEMDEGLLVKRSFRNYDPASKQFKKTAAGQGIEDTVEEAVSGIQQQVLKEDEERRAQDLDLLNIAPKRPNWDLKRDLKKRQAKLERRDKEAILMLIRQRIEAGRGAAGTTKDGESAGLNAMTAEMAASATAQRGAGRIGTQYDDDSDDSGREDEDV